MGIAKVKSLGALVRAGKSNRRGSPEMDAPWPLGESRPSSQVSGSGVPGLGAAEHTGGGGRIPKSVSCHTNMSEMMNASAPSLNLKQAPMCMRTIDSADRPGEPKRRGTVPSSGTDDHLRAVGKSGGGKGHHQRKPIGSTDANAPSDVKAPKQTVNSSNGLSSYTSTAPIKRNAISYNYLSSYDSHTATAPIKRIASTATVKDLGKVNARSVFSKATDIGNINDCDYPDGMESASRKNPERSRRLSADTTGSQPSVRSSSSAAAAKANRRLSNYSVSSQLSARSSSAAATKAKRRMSDDTAHSHHSFLSSSSAAAAKVERRLSTDTAGSHHSSRSSSSSAAARVSPAAAAIGGAEPASNVGSKSSKNDNGQSAATLERENAALVEMLRLVEIKGGGDSARPMSAELTESDTDLSRKLDEATNIVQELWGFKAEVESLRAENESLRRKAKRDKAQKKELMGEVKILRDDKALLRREIERLSYEGGEDLRRRADCAEDRNRDLESQLRRVEADGCNLRRELDRVTDENEELLRRLGAQLMEDPIGHYTGRSRQPNQRDDRLGPSLHTGRARQQKQWDDGLGPSPHTGRARQQKQRDDGLGPSLYTGRGRQQKEWGDGLGPSLLRTTPRILAPSIGLDDQFESEKRVKQVRRGSLN